MVHLTLMEIVERWLCFLTIVHTAVLIVLLILMVVLIGVRPVHVDTVLTRNVCTVLVAPVGAPFTTEWVFVVRVLFCCVRRKGQHSMSFGRGLCCLILMATRLVSSLTQVNERSSADC